MSGDLEVTYKKRTREAVRGRQGLDCHGCGDWMGKGYLTYKLYLEWQYDDGSSGGESYFFCSNDCRQYEENDLP
ncbi:unnamed protein product [Clonostachys byssicola]|uniref:Uncharacterized protein n=1 Tax=Clonostachys byssicola TaxID=160290 RepID=A0A9N9UXC5_9HYPO|nr:unnamed protein product [Clonostachys byssicola]